MIKTGRAAIAAAVCAFLAIASSGCMYNASASSVSLTFTSNVVRDHTSDGEASCDDKAELTIAMAGLRVGSMQVQVFDGEGATVFDHTYLGGEGGDDVRSLFGAPGDWTLSMHGRAEGQANVVLAC